MDALFPRLRQGLLAATFGQPERWWFQSELAAHLGTAPSSLQRELDALSSVGLLERRRDGRRIYYRAHQQAAIFEELRGLIRKTLGVTGRMRDLLSSFRPRIRWAFLYGSVAGGRERAESDLDVLVVGSVSLAELARAVRPLERELRRDINLAVYREDEFRRKLRARDHFLTSVVNGRIVFLCGHGHHLEALARQ